MRVLIVDDHAVVRAGLRQILASRAEEIGEADSGSGALDKVRERKWDAVVLDLGLPDMSGLEVIKQIRSQAPSLPILVLSMYAEEQYAERVLAAGGSGYLPKEAAPEQLMAALEKVVSGGRYVTPAMAERLVERLGTDPRKAPHERLSDREFEIFSLIAAGLSVSEIGEKLNLSVKTVSTYRSRVLEKMKLRNNAELIYYAIENRLVSETLLPPR